MESGLSLATDIERIALSEVRLLREALSGNEEARLDLVRPYEPGLWSVCAGMFDRTIDQQSGWQSFQDTLAEALNHFVVERPVGVQLYKHLWACLTLHLNDGTTPNVKPRIGVLPSRDEDEDRGRVLASLADCAPLDRAIWLFAAVTGLSMRSLADLTGHPEPAVRSAHARVSWVVHNALLS